MVNLLAEMLSAKAAGGKKRHGRTMLTVTQTPLVLDLTSVSVICKQKIGKREWKVDHRLKATYGH